jgi:hypothetical protein
VTIKVKVTFTSSDLQLGDRKRRQVISGVEVPFTSLTVDDLTHRIRETEAHLSRITGLTVKIETGAE